MKFGVFGSYARGESSGITSDTTKINEVRIKTKMAVYFIIFPQYPKGLYFL